MYISRMKEGCDFAINGIFDCADHGDEKSEKSYTESGSRHRFLSSHC